MALLSKRNLSSILIVVVGMLASACTTVTNAGGTTEIQFYNPLDTVGIAPSALRILYILIGILLLVAGWRLVDYIVAVAGFIVGASLGVSLLGNGNEVMALVGLVAGGLIGAVLALALQYVAIFAIGAYIGAILTAQIWALVSAAVLPTAVLIVGAIIGGVIVLALSFQFMVLVSAAVGAVLIGQVLALGPVWIFVLFILGVIVQVALASATRTPIFVRRRVVRRRIVRRRAEI
jgi:hypothetical protein